MSQEGGKGGRESPPPPKVKLKLVGVQLITIIILVYKFIKIKLYAVRFYVGNKTQQKNSLTLVFLMTSREVLLLGF